jgi:hypothetical protein
MAARTAPICWMIKPPQASNEGQRVTVTGTLDAPHKTIRVRKSKAVA